MIIIIIIDDGQLLCVLLAIWAKAPALLCSIDNNELLFDSTCRITGDCNWTLHSSPEPRPVPTWSPVLPHRLHLSCLGASEIKFKIRNVLPRKKSLALTFNSVASFMNASVTFLLSLADVSMHSRISGMYWHRASASENSTSRRSSMSLLLPIRNSITFDAVYRRTSSIQRCRFKKEDLFVMS